MPQNLLVEEDVDDGIIPHVFDPEDGWCAEAFIHVGKRVYTDRFAFRVAGVLLVKNAP